MSDVSDCCLCSVAHQGGGGQPGRSVHEHRLSIVGGGSTSRRARETHPVSRHRHQVPDVSPLT